MHQAIVRFLNEFYLDQNSTTGLLFLPLYIIISMILFAFQGKRIQGGKGPVLKRLLAFLFPKNIYFHPSSRLDFKMLFLNAIIAGSAALLGFASGFRFTNFLGSLHHGTQIWTMHLLAHPAPFTGLFRFTGFWVNLGFTIALAVARDFGRILVHYPMHKVPALWEIHKYHHNAEVLTPFTAYRLHPIESALSALSGGISHGICLSLFLWAFGPEQLSLVTLLGISVVKIWSNATGAFEHGNKWFSLGRLGFIFSNPAGHLVHHSMELRHRDKNFANHFAIFDLILGTLYIPKREEHFRIGVDHPDGTPLVTRSLVRQFYFNPVIEFGKALLRRNRAGVASEHAQQGVLLDKPANNCWCGPGCPFLADPSKPEAQAAPAWTGLGDLFGDFDRLGGFRRTEPQLSHFAKSATMSKTEKTF